MTGDCTAPVTGNAFLSGTLDFLDCQAQLVGASGYQALANPASPASLVVTSLLTLFVAVSGIRLLMGQRLDFGILLGAAIKLGIVLALASSWAAYRATIYDVVLKGPAEFFATVGEVSGLPGSEGGLTARLQAVDSAYLSLVEVGTGSPAINASTTADRAETAPKSISDGLAFSFGRTLFVGGVIGGLGLLRLVGGCLLALAPIMAGLLLFEATRGIFFGWLRSLLACALGAFLVTLVLAIELALVEPWLVDVLSRRDAQIATPAAPFEFLALSFAFFLIIFGAIWGAFKLSFAHNVPVHIFAGLVAKRQDQWQSLEEARYRREAGLDPPGSYARASEIADRLASYAPLPDRQPDALGEGRTPSARDPTGTPVRDYALPDEIVPLGESYGRTHRRASAAAARRSALA